MEENIIQIQSGITINVKFQCECKKHYICEKEYIRNPATCSCKNYKYLASIIDDSVMMSVMRCLMKL